MITRVLSLKLLPLHGHGPRLVMSFCVWLSLVLVGAPARAADELAWPAVTPDTRPWTYWWWMGSAVDETNLARELTRYRDAGLGGVHIIPIYGAKGWEDRYVKYLSPRWMELLSFTVTEAHKLGLGVDMTTGTGWCFGGPEVTDEEANASVICKIIEVSAGGRLDQKFDPAKTVTLMAFGPEDARRDLEGLIDDSGRVDWQPKEGPWRVYAVSQKFSGQKVKRAAPGGEGPMLNPFYSVAMRDYLRWFDKPFRSYRGPKPRAQYHDSYEYRSDWAPDFFAQFKKFRGYDLRDELPALFGSDGGDHAARVKSDYRETASDLMAEVTLPMWVKWSHRHGFLTRNEAHGSPGNWLDLYALADMPETEMFYHDRNKLISKFASSAAHVAGRQRVTSETGTWLAEHFTETLADMKYLLDDLYLSGVNHIFYHGTCYSPDEVPWPGWVFYASYEMNPRNSVWHDVPALNAYATRCQSVLQSGQPDNDVLVYWPIHDFWHDPEGLIRTMNVHARDWFEAQPIGTTASNLWLRGYAFDYVSDRQLAQAAVKGGEVQMRGARYSVILVPECQFMPLATLQHLLSVAKAGATVVFEGHLPEDVPGWGNLERRRMEFKGALAKLTFAAATPDVSVATIGKGRAVVSKGSGQWTSQLALNREPMVNQGLSFVRRSFDGGWQYFIANRGDQDFDGWVTLGRDAQSAVILDPMTGQSGVAAFRRTGGHSSVRLQLPAGAALILRAYAEENVNGPAWNCWHTNGEPVMLTGSWQVQFLQGGPAIPASFQTGELRSWTELGDTNAVRFAGTARYTLRFHVPGDRLKAGSQAAQLDLGKVCQSARVRLNGRDLGTLLTRPFRVVVDNLKPTDNVLEVDVTNTSANRIRDLDRRGVQWQNFHDINFVNLNYRKFDASNWPVADSGLLGPVTVTPVKAVNLAVEAN